MGRVGARECFPCNLVWLVLLANGKSYEVDFSTLYFQVVRPSIHLEYCFVPTLSLFFLAHIGICSLASINRSDTKNNQNIKRRVLRFPVHNSITAERHAFCFILVGFHAVRRVARPFDTVRATAVRVAFVALEQPWFKKWGGKKKKWNEPTCLLADYRASWKLRLGAWASATRSPCWNTNATSSSAAQEALVGMLKRLETPSIFSCPGVEFSTSIQYATKHFEGLPTLPCRTLYHIKTVHMEILKRASSKTQAYTRLQLLASPVSAQVSRHHWSCRLLRKEWANEEEKKATIIIEIAEMFQKI